MTFQYRNWVIDRNSLKIPYLSFCLLIASLLAKINGIVALHSATSEPKGRTMSWDTTVVAWLSKFRRSDAPNSNLACAEQMNQIVVFPFWFGLLMVVASKGQATIAQWRFFIKVGESLKLRLILEGKNSLSFTHESLDYLKLCETCTTESEVLVRIPTTMCVSFGIGFYSCNTVVDRRHLHEEYSENDLDFWLLSNIAFCRRQYFATVILFDA